MRKKIRVPRILKINWIDGLRISVVFNNGESRIIDFSEVFSTMSYEAVTKASILKKPEEFRKVKLSSGTMSWNNVEQYIHTKDGTRIRVPFEIGPDTLLEFSKPDDPEPGSRIGGLIREARIQSGITQQELASRSGTTRNYISRIENDRSDIEIATLRKIIETGLGKTLQIIIK